MPTANGFDTKLIKELANILNDCELSEIELDQQGIKIRVAKTINITTNVPAPAPIYAPQAPIAAPAPSANAPAAAPAKPSGNIVTSPMVGSVYLSAEPGAKPFVNVGDTVKEGQQLFIVEAMKTLNAVNSPYSGVVKEILITNAQPVEFGENLCIIE